MSHSDELPRLVPFKAFWRGLTLPSALALTVAIGILIILSGVILAGTERFVASPWGGYLAASRIDYETFVTRKLLELTPGASERPLVALVGASVTRSSFGTEPDIEAEVERTTGVAAEALILCTGRQTMLEHVAVIERLIESGRPVEIVLGIGPSRFTNTPEVLNQVIQQPGLGVRSDWVNEEVLALGLPPNEPMGNYAIDNRHFLLARLQDLPRNLARGLLRGYTPTEIQTFWLGRHIEPEEYDWHSRQVMTRFADYDGAFSINLAILERLVERVKAAPQARLILVEHAINPAFLRDYLTPERYNAHVARMHAWAEEKDVTYLTLAADAGLTEDDFYDWAHVSSPEAYARLRGMLAASLDFDR
jgi:hypothetical protein